VHPSVQQLGDAWITSGRSSALQVLSVVVEGEFNLLINPAHADFALVTVDTVSPYEFDQRLLR